MRNKSLGAGEPGYHRLRTIRTELSSRPCAANSAIEALCNFVEPRHSEKILVAADAMGVSIFA